jgi:hypothetical protein
MDILEMAEDRIKYLKNMKKVLMIAISVLSWSGCTFQDKPVKLNTYEMVLQNGDTTYVQAYRYECRDGFFHSAEPMYVFFDDHTYMKEVIRIQNPISLKKIK